MEIYGKNRLLELIITQREARRRRTPTFNTTEILIRHIQDALTSLKFIEDYVISDTNQILTAIQDISHNINLVKDEIFSYIATWNKISELHLTSFTSSTTRRNITEPTVKNQLDTLIQSCTKYILECSHFTRYPDDYISTLTAIKNHLSDLHEEFQLLNNLLESYNFCKRVLSIIHREQLSPIVIIPTNSISTDFSYNK